MEIQTTTQSSTILWFTSGQEKTVFSIYNNQKNGFEWPCNNQKTVLRGRTTTKKNGIDALENTHNFEK